MKFYMKPEVYQIIFWYGSVPALLLLGGLALLAHLNG